LARPANIDGLILRLAVEDDLQQIHLIEQLSNPFPWNIAQLQSSLNLHQVLLVEQKKCSDENQIVAFLIYQQVLDEASLLHIAVASNKKSQGIGHFILVSWLDMLPKTIIKVWLEVRQSNLIAQKLYRACGFIKTSSRPGYYQHHLTNPELSKEAADIFCLDRS